MKTLRLLFVLAFVLTLVAAVADAAPICDFQCLTPGAANQAACAPVAAHIHADWNPQSELLTFTYDRWNGTLITSIYVEVGNLSFAQFVNIHSNGGTYSVSLPGAPDTLTVSILGITDPQRVMFFTADCTDCGAPTPEPQTWVAGGLGLLLIGASHPRIRRRRWTRR